MRRMSRFVGLPVIVDGEKCGMVNRVCIDIDGRLSGFSLNCGARGQRWLKVDDVRCVGEISLIAGRMGDKRCALSNVLLKRVLTAEGDTLGRVKDVFIDEDALTVAGLDISYGFFDDWFYARSMISEFTIINQSGDIILPQDAVTLINQEVGS